MIFHDIENYQIKKYYFKSQNQKMGSEFEINFFIKNIRFIQKSKDFDISHRIRQRIMKRLINFIQLGKFFNNKKNLIFNTAKSFLIHIADILKEQQQHAQNISLKIGLTLVRISKLIKISQIKVIRKDQVPNKLIMIMNFKQQTQNCFNQKIKNLRVVKRKTKFKQSILACVPTQLYLNNNWFNQVRQQRKAVNSNSKGIQQ
ncbi:unnamed protein product (macronuclear) [Paramecium tetraurelia]|uniref:Transmembrane protein n=1 Tax=Paramecium tetraurelia TaxID=5888 RepID=A0CRN7_PARTE|nr:uncharacterized protein GSPATT00009769001 [Paramecium tetraurelia]CAK73454.1 unnamed protein product [Paramecium tetraurelia]|eukprot:XP_001440851.1 hypothetical protein (macronuclear) [Paramecium tetraurelia strain d4-2]